MYTAAAPPPAVTEANFASAKLVLIFESIIRRDPYFAAYPAGDLFTMRVGTHPTVITTVKRN
jgi:hypothetical protein